MTLSERLRAALEAPPPPDLLPGDDILQGEDGEAQAAAVLVAITDRPRPGVLLTVRREHLRHHAGQISFPGGRIDPDDSGPIAAALREAEEEIGLPSSAVTVWGMADRYRTITNFAVTPVLGSVAADLPLAPHEAEVAEWFEAPLDFVLDPANHTAVDAEYRGAARTYYQINWENRRIWGATAAMLVNLSRRMR